MTNKSDTCIKKKSKSAIIQRIVIKIKTKSESICSIAKHPGYLEILLFESSYFWISSYKFSSLNSVSLSKYKIKCGQKTEKYLFKRSVLIKTKDTYFDNKKVKESDNNIPLSSKNFYIRTYAY